MQETQFAVIGLVVNTQKPEAYPLAVSLIPWLRERGKTVLADPGVASRARDGVRAARSITEVAQHADLIVVFGGDGTLLNVAGQMDGHDVPVFGVKMGGLGFLTEVMEDEVQDTLEAVFAGRHRVTKRILAEATIHQNPAGVCGPFPALNDLVFARESPAKMVALETFADGVPLTRYLCDGLIFSTPTGSTGHNLSAGGPIIEPHAEVFVLNPICPHTLSMRPIVLNPAIEITVRVASTDASVHLVCDGQEVAMLAADDRVTIRRAKQVVRTVCSLDRDYYTILRTKLRWGER